MTIQTEAIVDALASHALTTGLFESANAFEPKNPPGNGVHCGIWANRLTPARGRSGLASTTALLVFTVRVYTSFLREPQGMIDPNMLTAVDALLTAYSGDFALGGAVANIDLLGAHGSPLEAQAGYLTHDQKVYRIMTITVPMVINDAWNQVS